MEYGTATQPAGNHLALATEKVRINLPLELLADEAGKVWGGS